MELLLPPRMEAAAVPLLMAFCAAPKTIFGLPLLGLSTRPAPPTRISSGWLSVVPRNSVRRACVARRVPRRVREHGKVEVRRRNRIGRNVVPSRNPPRVHIRDRARGNVVARYATRRKVRIRNRPRRDLVARHRAAREACRCNRTVCYAAGHQRIAGHAEPLVGSVAGAVTPSLNQTRSHTPLLVNAAAGSDAVMLETPVPPSNTEYSPFITFKDTALDGCCRCCSCRRCSRTWCTRCPPAGARP